MNYTLTRLPGSYAVCQLPPSAPVPSWAQGGGFYSITRTADELSIICDQAHLPDPPDSLPVESHVARGWLLWRVEGPFAFDVTGVIATLSAPLAQAGVVTLAVATYQTDYLLIKGEQRQAFVQALTQAGHHLIADNDGA
jgi:hypothetical protein